MKNGYRNAFLLIGFLLLSFLILGCPPPPTPDPVSTVLFSDNFEYPVAGPWTPSNGWSSTASWEIVTGGVTGNALRFPPNTWGATMVNNYTNSNYKVSVRARPVATVANSGGWPICVIARYQDDDNYYCIGVQELTAGDGNTYLIFVRNVAGSGSLMASAKLKDGLLDNSLYYTLTITTNGTNITGTCSGGGSLATITATASDFASGKVGIYMWTGSSTYDVLFDDFTVTDF